MRILHVNHSFTGAGVENVMKTLGKGLSKEGCQVYYAAYDGVTRENAFHIRNPVYSLIGVMRKTEKFVHTIKRSGKGGIPSLNASFVKKINLNARGLIPLIDPVTASSMSKIIKNVEPDLIHCHNVLPSLAPLSIPKMFGIPVVATLHGYWPICPLSNLMQLRTGRMCSSRGWESCSAFCAYRFVNVEKYMKKLRDVVTENVDSIVPVSNFVKTRLVDFSYPKDRITVVPNGIDVETFGSEENLPVQHRVIHVGRLSLEKGSHIFLRTAENMLHKHPEIEFLLIGSAERVHFRHISNVRCLGWVSSSELKRLYSTALCVVVPSIWPEPHPLVPIESMACRTPVIGSRIGGIKETIVDGKNGFLIEVGNEERMVKQIIEKMEYFLENEEERHKMGLEAREHVKDRFSLDRMVSNYRKIYEGLVR